MSTDNAKMKPDQPQIVSRLMEAYKCSSDQELGDKLGVSKGTISNYRRGRRSIPMAIISKASSDTEISTDWLLHGPGVSTTSVPIPETPPPLIPTLDLDNEASRNLYLGRAMSALTTIFNSRDILLIQSILANLFSFERAILREAENNALQTKLEEVTRRLDHLEEKAGADDPLRRKLPKMVTSG